MFMYPVFMKIYQDFQYIQRTGFENDTNPNITFVDFSMIGINRSNKELCMSIKCMTLKALVQFMRFNHQFSKMMSEQRTLHETLQGAYVIVPALSNRQLKQ